MSGGRVLTRLLKPVETKGIAMVTTDAFKLGSVHGFEWACDHTFTSAELRDVSRRCAETFIGSPVATELTVFMQGVLQSARSDYMLGYRQAAQAARSV